MGDFIAAGAKDDQFAAGTQTSGQVLGVAAGEIADGREIATEFLLDNFEKLVREIALNGRGVPVGDLKAERVRFAAR